MENNSFIKYRGKDGSVETGILSRILTQGECGTCYIVYKENEPDVEIPVTEDMLIYSYDTYSPADTPQEGE